MFTVSANTSDKTPDILTGESWLSLISNLVINQVMRLHTNNFSCEFFYLSSHICVE